MSRPDIIAAYRLRGSSSFKQLGHCLVQGQRPFVTAHERRLRHRALEHARTDRVPLGLIGVEQALRRCAVDHLGELPAQVHRVLDPDVESLSARRRMHVRRIAGQEHASRSVRRRLPRRIAEPREPRDVVNAEVGAVDGDERLAQIVEGRLVALPDLRLDQHDAHALAVLELADGIDALVTAADAPAPARRSSRPRQSSS